MSLNKKLMDEYEMETGCVAIYQREGSTYHFLKYVDWLEDRASKSFKVADNSASANISSPKLPELEEVFNKIMIDYRKSSWLYPPTRNVIKWVLEFVAGKIGR